MVSKKYGRSEKMKEFKKNGIVLARHIAKSDINDGLSFFSNDNEFIQVGTWNYNKGKQLMRHYHNEVERKISRTYEVLYIISGSIKANIYDLDNKFEGHMVVENGDILILLESGHGYEVLEENTKVLEVKNGPYLGPNIDRTRF